LNIENCLLQVKFTKSGVCHGFVLWIDWVMDLQNSTVISTGPGHSHLHYLWIFRKQCRIRIYIWQTKWTPKTELILVKDLKQFYEL